MSALTGDTALVLDLARASSLAYESHEYVAGAWAAAHAAPPPAAGLPSPFSAEHIELLRRVAAPPRPLDAKNCDASMYTMVYAPDGAPATLLLAFRGTDSALDALCDISVCKVRFRTREPGAGAGEVHSGFNEQWECLRALCGPAVLRFLGEHPGQGLVCCGHSLGAGLATLAALYYAPAAAVRLAAFGCPRVGDRAFVDALEAGVADRVRVVHGADPITKVPYSGLGYAHFEPAWRIGRADGHPRAVLPSDLPDHDHAAYVRALSALLSGAAAEPGPAPALLGKVLQFLRGALLRLLRLLRLA